MTAHVLAVDLGGTDLRAAVVDESGSLLSFAATETASVGGPAIVIEQIVRLVGEVRAQAGEPTISGLGVGAPGPLDPIAGVAIAPPTLTGWHDVPLASLLEARLRLPVRLENDANAAALGEWRFGAGRGTQSMVFVTVSTGIGGGVIADGHLLRGRRGLAGEIGHMTIAEGTERCFCGARGCWEAMASGSALGWRGTERAQAPDGARLRALAEPGPVTAGHVGEAAREGDPLALSLLDDEAYWLGVGFVNLLHLYSPERLIVGGGVSACLDLMAKTIARTVDERAMSAYCDVPIVAAALGRNAGLVGAASLVM